MPWMRVGLLVQIVMGGLQELTAHERREARAIAQRVYRERQLSANDRQKLMQLARKAGKGAVRGARSHGLSGVRGRRR
jgi:hypothetical protein